MEASIMVATHKLYEIPQDALYVPLQVGRVGKQDLGYTGDDTGENISDKNKNYCELTGLFWAWKNVSAEYIGLVHYRRYFAGRWLGKKQARILTMAQLQAMLSNTDVIVPKQRNYWIETNYSQYCHAHHAADLDVTRVILTEKYPHYVAAFDAVMRKTKGHRFNMLIMRKAILDAYCTWLFDVLFTLEQQLDISAYNSNDARVFGFVSERLLDVWLIANQITYQELPVVAMERQHWLKKGTAFLQRKYVRKP